MITIAGRPVKVGDQVYHLGRAKWGKIIREDDNSMVMRIEGLTKDNYVELFVTANGVVQGKRQIYWHEPLHLDLPVSDISKVQRFVNFSIGEFGYVKEVNKNGNA